MILIKNYDEFKVGYIYSVLEVDTKDEKFVKVDEATNTTFIAYDAETEQLSWHAMPATTMKDNYKFYEVCHADEFTPTNYPEFFV